MARGKRRGGRRGSGLGKWVNRGFKVLGTVVAAGPAINAVAADISHPQDIPVDVAYGYSGYNVKSGAFNQNQLIAGLASVVVGIGIGKLGGILGKMMR